MNKFKILYTDGTEVIGDTFEGDWKKLDDTKQIVKLEYVLGNIHVTMTGFKQYNHFKERLGLQVKGYSKVILMGRTEGDSTLVVFDLIKKKYDEINKPHGQEYGIQILNGWQEGKLDNPKVDFKKLNDKDLQA